MKKQKKKVQKIIPVNTKAKDTFFKKVYEKEERQRALVSFLLGIEGREVSLANVRPVLFGNKENDFACMCDDVFYVLVEGQSSVSPNISYRLLEYAVAGLRATVDSEQLLYGMGRVCFPIPKLYVLQVGLEKQEEYLSEKVQYDVRLSESYVSAEERYGGGAPKPDLEAVVHVYDYRMTLDEILVYIEQNILPDRFDAYDNDMKNYALVANGITYMQRTDKDKQYVLPENTADVAEYLKLLLSRGVFVDLLSDKEVCDMTMAQFSRDDILIYQGREEGREEGRMQGIVQGKAESIIELLEEIGEPSEELRKQIMEQTDFEVLRKWNKTAARVESIEEFEQAVGFVQV